jgi:hypothetical protein
MYICYASKNVHACGEKCNKTFLAENSEGFVCGLTGRCISGCVTSTFEPPVLVKGRTVWMTKTTRVHRDRRLPRTSHAKMGSRVLDRITDTLRLIFSSTQRANIVEVQKKRLGVFIDKICRTKSTTIIEMDLLVLETITRLGPSLRSPPVTFGTVIHKERACVLACFVSRN